MLELSSDFSALTAVSTDMKEEALAPFGRVEVLDKFRVATVTTYMELKIQRACVQGNNRAVRDDINYRVNL